MAPTRIYVKPLLRLLDQVPVAALSHITGGGITENVPRSLPDGVAARISPDSWTRPAIFDWLQHHGGIEDSEMLRTFNCGIGMIAVVPPSEVDASIELLTSCGESVHQIGVIEGTAADAAPQVLYS